ncbi:MAG: protein kinase [Acidobacteriota bacterium]|nr:MAG: protein kinase [Acidobacteriota bacterium]
MAKVYLARDSVLGRQVAIKVLSPELAWDEDARARFLREARVMATLEHPHIVRVYAIGTTDGQPYLAMEYVAGESLARRIWSSERLEINESLRIVRECVQALSTAWDHGIVHRDLKPSNILLDASGHARVADFGLAKSTKWLEEITLPDAGVLLCTPHYVSPEQARGDEVIDFRSDIYSLGIVLFELLTGERPFRGKSPMAVLLKNVNDPLPDIRTWRPELPENVAALVEWMTRKHRERRPNSYEELEQRLEYLGSQSSVAARELLVEPPSLPSLLGAEQPVEETPREVFVGREAELEQLEQLLAASVDGRGQAAFVLGEAGTGKTALLHQFALRASEVERALIIASASCTGTAQIGDAYGPFRQILAQLTGDLTSSCEDLPLRREHLIRLWRTVPAAARALTVRCPDLLATFVDAEALARRAKRHAPSGTDWLERLDSAVERLAARGFAVPAPQVAVFDQYGRFLSALAESSPLLVVIDDLHRADPSSLALLAALARQAQGSRILIIGAYRGSEAALEPSGTSPSLELVVDELASLTGENQIRLDEAGDRRFVDALVDRSPNALGEDFRQRLFERTNGHPLFTIELLQALQARGYLRPGAHGRWVTGKTVDWDLEPERVGALIRGRLGRLPPRLRELLLIASVEGESFTGEVLARVAGVPPGEIVRMLSEELGQRARLVTSQGVRSAGAVLLSRYRFSHALFQAHLRESLDPARCMHLHGAVGEALEFVWGDRTDDVSALLAEHFGQAGRLDKAIEYTLRAGQRATLISANEEAIRLLSLAHELCSSLPESIERNRRELEILLALLVPVSALRGFGAEEVRDHLCRAEDLALSLDDKARLCDVLGILVAYEVVASLCQRALDHSTQQVDTAEAVGDAGRIIAAHAAHAMTLHMTGSLEQSRTTAESGLELFDATGSRRVDTAVGIDAIVVIRCWLGHSLRILVYADREVAQYREAIARALGLGQPYGHALARLHWGGSLVDHGLVELAEENHRVLEHLMHERGLVFFSAWTVFYGGFLAVKRGDSREGLGAMKRGLAVFETLRGGARAMMLRDLAAAHCDTGMVEDGLTIVSDALAEIETTAERVYEAELWRVKADLFFARGRTKDGERAEACYNEALEISRQQKAKAWELRAALGLGRLWHRQGKPHEARELLEKTYGWFTEGLGFPDLEQARRLLDAWSPVD